MMNRISSATMANQAKESASNMKWLNKIEKEKKSKTVWVQ